jgi:hypothetical protein
MQGQVLREFARMEAVKAACQDPASLEHAIAMRAFQRIETIVQVGVGILQGISRDAGFKGSCSIAGQHMRSGSGFMQLVRIDVAAVVPGLHRHLICLQLALYVLNTG